MSKVLLGTLVAAVLAPVVALKLAVVDEPVVMPRAEVPGAEAQAWLMFRRSLPPGTFSTLVAGQPVSVVLGASEAKALTQAAVSKMWPARADVHMGANQVQVQLSTPVQETPLRALALWGAWLNVQAQWNLVDPQTGRPRLQSVTVGTLPVPAFVATWAVEAVAARMGMDDALAVASGLVRQATSSERDLRVSLQLTDALKARGFAMLVPTQDWPALPQQRDVLVKAMRQHGCSVAKVLPPMFELARQRSMAWSLTQSGETTVNHAARENRAVLLVAALHAVKWPIDKVLPNAADWVSKDVDPLCLHGRVDFAQHFLMSAWLASQAGGRISNAMGQFKEVLDSTPGAGGSGFSFNDIAADLAGSRLGQVARLNPVRLQNQVLILREDTDWMPPVDDLPQFMSAQEMAAAYGGPGHPAYDRMWLDIQARVNRLPVLQ